MLSFPECGNFPPYKRKLNRILLQLGFAVDFDRHFEPTADVHGVIHSGVVAGANLLPQSVITDLRQIDQALDSRRVT